MLPIDHWRYDARIVIFATWLVSHLCLLAHLSLVLSTYFRWAALGLAFCATLGWLVLTVFVIESIYPFRMAGPGGMDMQSVLFLIATVFVFFACMHCHVMLVLRMRRLSEQ
ncbi:MAG: hypothetical protein H7062_08365 [Candidatus Saccharimonas sp.]|nr:hypothetical protein [Planctomycetaceae bacterium]